MDHELDDDGHLPPGTTIADTFRVEHVLRSGAMGVVYAATDLTLDRRVALTVFTANDDGERWRQTRTMARLAHPNLPTVHDVGVHDERVFVVLERVEGPTVREWIARPRAWRDVLAVFVQAARGLAAAHRAGVVHGDVTPDNIVLGSDGRVRVIDFGVGTATPDYAPPDATDDQHRDRFAFFVSLHEALFGVRPPISGAPRRRVPTWLRAIVEHGLRPDHRIADMADVVAALRNRPKRRYRWPLRIAALLCAGAAGWGAVAIAREHRRQDCLASSRAIDDAWNEDRRQRLRDALVGTGLPFAEDAFARAVPFAEAHAASWRRSYAELCVATEVDRARDASLWTASRACLLDRRDELASLVDALIETPDATSVHRTVSAFADLGSLEPCADPVWLARHPARAGHDFGPLRRRLRRVTALQAAGRYEEAHRLAASLVEAVDVGDSELLAAALVARGELASETGRYEEAARSLSEAFDLALGRADDDAALDAATALVETTGYLQARPAEALRWARVGWGLAGRLDVSDDPAGAALSFATGLTHWSAGRYAEAEREHARALEIWERHLGPDHPNVSAAHVHLGNEAKARDDPRAAERHYLRAIAGYEQALGPAHPYVAAARHALGSFYGYVGRNAEAEREIRRALELRERLRGPDHPSVATTLNTLGGVHLAQGRYEDAERELTRAMTIVTTALSVDHPRAADVHRSFGALYLAQNRRADAKRSFARALAILERSMGAAHPDAAEIRRELDAVTDAR